MLPIFPPPICCHQHIVMGHEQLRVDELVAQKEKTVVNDQLALTFRDGGS